MFKKLGLVFTGLLLCTSFSYAQATTNSTTVVEKLKSASGVKDGLLIDYAHQRALNFAALEILNKYDFSLDAGLVGTDGVGAAVTYNLEGLKKFGVGTPVTSVLKYINVGYGAAYRTITFTQNGDDTNSKSDNLFIHGPVVFAKWNF